jgi:lactate permease
MSYNGIFSFIIASVPIIWLLISLSKLKMPAYLASIIAFALTVVIAVLYYAMPALRVMQATVEGTMLALFPILFVIVSALFVYNTTLKTGSMDKIKSMLSSLSPDRRIQGLILAFAFGGFLEAVAGFGTAVAIPAGILVAMGFRPILVAKICLIANTVPVAFGVLGVPIITLSQVTSLPLDKITLYTALQLIPLAVILPIVLVFAITGSVKKIKGVLCISLLSGIIFSVGQTLTAVYIGPELAAVVGSLLSLLVIVTFLKIFPVKNAWTFSGEKSEGVNSSSAIGATDAIKAWSSYLLILLLVFAVKFIPALNILNNFPFTVSKQFYFGVGGKPMSFQLATSSGTILLVSAILGGLIQGASVKILLSVLTKTIKQIKRTIITVVSIVVLAKVMGYSGMVNSIANTLAAASGRFYPIIAPLIGTLGTFITGSDTSSNVLFGNLQKQTALQLGMNPEWLASANATGATIGKMISPQSIAIASTATDLTNQEGKILGETIKYCLVFVVIMGLLIYAFSGIIKFLP